MHSDLFEAYLFNKNNLFGTRVVHRLTKSMMGGNQYGYRLAHREKLEVFIVSFGKQML